MRVLFTGQTGIDKKSQLRALSEYCAERGRSIDAVFNIGDVMYAESGRSGHRLAEGKILDLPLAQLGALRRSAFNLVRSEVAEKRNVLVNSHAVFRWNNRLIRAFELPEVRDLQPDAIVTLIDDVEAVKLRLDRYKESGELPPDIRYSLKDLLVWREEEILASEILASVLDTSHYVLGVSLADDVSATPLDVMYSLIFEPWRKKSYVSYPIGVARSKPEVWERVVAFRKLARKYLTAFDPLMIDEKRLVHLAQRSAGGSDDVECVALGQTMKLSRREIESIADDIDGQIVARDLKLIDQSEMVVAHFPADAQGEPVIAGGVQSEIEYAAAAKKVVILWEATRDPTPFIGQRGDVVVRSMAELEEHLKSISQQPGQREMQL